MSPEQCRDAATVDHRADIYSLGCTLYVLVTGRQPFHGTTAIELMTKQAYEPIVPPERIVARVPAELSAVIQRMMAKSPNDRFQSMDEVIRTLEAWLGVRTGGTFCPREEEITRLEGLVHAFNAASRPFFAAVRFKASPPSERWRPFCCCLGRQLVARRDRLAGAIGSRLLRH